MFLPYKIAFSHEICKDWGYSAYSFPMRWHTFLSMIFINSLRELLFGSAGFSSFMLLKLSQSPIRPSVENPSNNSLMASTSQGIGGFSTNGRDGWPCFLLNKLNNFIMIFLILFPFPPLPLKYLPTILVPARLQVISMLKTNEYHLSRRQRPQYRIDC